MAITFPRTLPDEMLVAQQSFYLEDMTERAPLRGGSQLFGNIGPSLWRSRWESRDNNPTQLGIIRAFIDTLRTGGTFYAYDKLREYPLAYATGWGSLVVGMSPFNGTCSLTSVESNNVEINLSNLPANFVFKRGDYIAWDYGTRRALHRIVADITANGSGVVKPEVRPYVRPGITFSATAYLYRAACLMCIEPSSYQDPVSAPWFSDVSFEAVQSL